MKHQFFRALCPLLIFCFCSCNKNKLQNLSDQLPPATQTGANTFGCLVNGQVYIPKGFSGTGTPNPRTTFEFFNGNNIFSINTYQYQNTNPVGFLSITFLNPVINLGIYDYPQKMNFSVGWSKVINSCFTPAFDTTVQKWGTAVITRFDNTNKVVSGNFNFKFKTTDCDTVFVTDGRFDFKF